VISRLVDIELAGCNANAMARARRCV